jgi:hypothetical protein
VTNTVVFKGNQGANYANTQYGPSPFLWNRPGIDIPAIEADPNRGIFQRIGWGRPMPLVAAGSEANYGSYKGFASTGGSAAALAAVGGGLTFSSDGDDEGASIVSSVPAFKINRDTGMVIFEAAFKVSTIADTKFGLYCGLIEAITLSATVPIAAAGTLADRNLVGFHRLEGDGDYLDTVYKADGVTQVTVGADAQVLVADTVIKAGFIYNPSDSYKLRYFGNGVELANTAGTYAGYTVPSALGTDFPNDVTLGMCFAILNATASTPGSASLIGMQCLQTFDY